MVAQSIIDLANEVIEWMDGQRDSQFPFCDSYLMWHDFSGTKFNDIETYNCTFPYWREHGNTVMEDIMITGTFKEQIAKIMIVKGTEKGIMIPNHPACRQQTFVIKGDIDFILGKDPVRLLNTLEVNDYKLFPWASRKLDHKIVRKDGHISVGNLWNYNAHLKEGDIIVHVTHYDK